MITLIGRVVSNYSSADTSPNL